MNVTLAQYLRDKNTLPQENTLASIISFELFSIILFLD
jgi:hypothetical protein